VLARNRLVRIDARAVLHLLARQIQVDNISSQICVADRVWRNQHLPFGRPASSIDHEIADTPRLVIEIDVLHTPYVAIACNDSASVKVVQISQHARTPFQKSGRRCSAHDVTLQ
jgi:hypothetical protein